MDQTRDNPMQTVAVVVSRYNASITDRLLEGALVAFERRGGRREEVLVVDSPGAFELVGLARRLAESFDGIVALGCIIRGETDHDRYIARAVTDGLAALSVQTGRPVAFGVLTVESAEQALERAGGAKGNKGEEAMDALLDVLVVSRRLEAGERTGRIVAGRRPRDKSGAEGV